MNLSYRLLVPFRQCLYYDYLHNSGGYRWAWLMLGLGPPLRVLSSACECLVGLGVGGVRESSVLIKTRLSGPQMTGCLVLSNILSILFAFLCCMYFLLTEEPDNKWTWTCCVPLQKTTLTLACRTV